METPSSDAQHSAPYLRFIREKLVQYHEPFGVIHDSKLQTVLRRLDDDHLSIQEAHLFKVQTSEEKSEYVLVLKCKPQRNPDEAHITLYESQYVAWPVPPHDTKTLDKVFKNLQRHDLHVFNDDQKSFKRLVSSTDPLIDVHVQSGNVAYNLLKPIEKDPFNGSVTEKTSASFQDKLSTHLYLTNGIVTNELHPDFSGFKAQTGLATLEMTDERDLVDFLPRSSFDVVYYPNTFDRPSTTMMDPSRMFLCQENIDYTLACTMDTGRQMVYSLTPTSSIQSGKQAQIVKEIRGYGRFGFDFGQRTGAQKITYVWNNVPTLGDIHDFHWENPTPIQSRGRLSGTDDSAGASFRIFVNQVYIEREFTLVMIDDNDQRTSPYLQWNYDDRLKQYWAHIPTTMTKSAHDSLHRYTSNYRLVGMENNTGVILRSKSVDVGIAVVDQFGISSPQKNMTLELFQGNHRWTDLVS